MLDSLVHLFFPKVCFACKNFLNDNEDSICVDCRHDLPVTNYHFNDDKHIENVLYGRARIENGTALFRYEKKGIVQQLIHNLKYKDQEKIGFVLGNWLGEELKTISNYQSVDVVIPVPLHAQKLRKRGYNQVALFAKQIAHALNVNYNDTALLKTTNTKSQVNKKRLARWNNSSELFILQNKTTIENKHILLVDDIITTGATLEACILVLQQAENIKISIATMAITV